MDTHTPDRALLFAVFPVGIAACLALALSGCSKNASPTNPSPPPPGAGSAVFYTAIGASDTTGYGSSVPCVPFTDCPNGTGYVQRLVRSLKALGASVTLSNLGIPAAVVGPDFQTLGTTYGRQIPGNFIQNELPFVPRDTTLVTIFAGGNDTNTVVAAIGDGAGGSDPVAFANTQIAAFGADMQTMIAGIKDRAPSARIIVANLPNFAGLPLAAGYAMNRKQLAQKISVGFSTQVINKLTSQGIIVVDVLCSGWPYVASNYSSDGFHPNDAGYARFADEFMRAITSGSSPAPLPSCQQMNLVPSL